MLCIFLLFSRYSIRNTSTKLEKTQRSCERIRHEFKEKVNWLNLFEFCVVKCYICHFCFSDTPHTPPNFLMRDTEEVTSKNQPSSTCKTNHITFKLPSSCQDPKSNNIKQNGPSTGNFNLQRAKSSGSMVCIF